MKFFSLIKLNILSLLQHKLIFKPWLKNIDDVKHPEDYGLSEVAVFNIKSGKADRLEIWCHQPKSENSNMFIFFHGNTGHFGDVGQPKPNEKYNRRYRIEFLKEIAAQGNGFIVVSLRGYGNSTGKPSKEAFVEDTKSIAEFLAKENFKNLVIIGESMGAFSALNLNDDLLNHGIISHIVTLIAPFSSIKNRVVEMYPEFGQFNVEKYIGQNLDNEATLSKTKYNGKILLIHPENDETTPISSSYKLLDTGLKQNLNIKLVPLPHVGHITWDAKNVLEIIDANLS